MSLKRIHGITLVEVLVAVFVLAAGLIPAMYVFSRGNMGTVMTRDEILAHAYATELIDFGQAMGFDAMSPDTYKNMEMKSIPGGLEIDSRFHRTIHVVERIPAGGIANWPIQYRVLQVQVTWTSSGVVQKYALTGLLFKGRGGHP